ncbi:4-hydroxythreonine-4-phosphate dehydrogenase PdxA [uncultured Anaerotruncus sp.]|uniref:4-hydroxythreonine-4-phosphate dehydrogenase PdxA n=1 Tax=uncultured Anaerotruncus sp. TaxID=905011 RepID=UPI00280AFF32|nr:4-hydroxythreonine-4-phosphate dehydrogenase PdxA [uncultured Anaerotruncus sp.]
MHLPRIAITMGDPAGIGAETAVKAIASGKPAECCLPVLIGERRAVEDAMSFCGLSLPIREVEGFAGADPTPGTLNLLNLGVPAYGSWKYGTVSAAAGEAAFQYIKRAIDLALCGQADAVVTGPINKEALHLAGYAYAGHTEIFAELSGTKSYAMLLTTPALRVIHATTHVSMRRACELITRERVEEVVRLADQVMRRMGIARPRIAVAGLNPHCSENGLFGTEEADVIIPAVRRCAAAGLDVDGPLPPDTVFTKAVSGLYDVVVAMYHDQGHIPAKLMGFRMDPVTKEYESVSGVNTTVGLPFIRTSVDHGTAFDRAGQGRANPESMLDAIEMAARMCGHSAEAYTGRNQALRGRREESE